MSVSLCGVSLALMYKRPLKSFSLGSTVLVADMVCFFGYASYRRATTIPLLSLPNLCIVPLAPCVLFKPSVACCAFKRSS